MALGALCGGTVAGVVKGDVLMLVFGLVALLVAWNMALPKTRLFAPALPERTGVQPTLAGGVGLVSSMMGIGSGTIGVPLMTAFCVPVHRAVGTAAALGLVIGVPGALAMLVTGLSPMFANGVASVAIWLLRSMRLGKAEYTARIFLVAVWDCLPRRMFLLLRVGEVRWK